MSNKPQSAAAVWLTWEKQVRNRSLSSKLHTELVEIRIPGGHFRRYFISSLVTIRVLWGWRGKVVFAQNPSIVLTLLVLLLKPIFRYRAVIDAHNASIPSDQNSGVLNSALKYALRFADVTIVTNNELASKVLKIGGKAVVLPDPLPDIHVGMNSIIRPDPTVLFICTWASDEPYLEVFEAAELLPNVKFLVTGSSKDRELAYGKPLPANVLLTGYVPDADYHDLLSSCHAVIDLTTREDCLVCGAYEAVAVSTPFILSSSRALKEYFYKGGVHVDNNAAAIAKGVQTILDNRVSFKHEICLIKSELMTSWSDQLQNVRPALFG